MAILGIFLGIIGAILYALSLGEILAHNKAAAAAKKLGREQPKLAAATRYRLVAAGIFAVLAGICSLIMAASV